MMPHPWPAFLSCCGAAIFGVRTFLIEQFGASVPLVHEWEATGLDTLAAWHEGTYTLAALVEPHNGDHPTVFTRLWEILWFEINGAWDPKLVMTAKAAVFAAAATIFLHLLAGRLERGRFVVAAVLAALFAFPFNWHNLLWGVASQFDFFFLAAALGWLALQRERPWLALLCAFAALFTNGAGPVVAASFGPFFVFAWIWGSWRLRDALVGAGVAAFIVVLGLAMHTGDAEPHVGTLGEKSVTLAKLYAWPFGNAVALVERLPESTRFFPGSLVAFPSRDDSWLLQFGTWVDAHPGAVVAAYLAFAVVLQAPLLLLLHALRRGRIPWTLACGPLTIALLAGLMLAATALARASQTTIAVRYLDHVALAGFCAIAAAAVVATRLKGSRPWLAGWALLLVIGYVGSAAITLTQMAPRYPDAALAVMQRYFATHDRAVLTTDDTYRGLIFDATPDGFIALLNERRLQPVLPRAVVAPLEPLTRVAALASQLGQWSPALVGLVAVLAAWLARQNTRNTPRVAGVLAAPA